MSCLIRFDILQEDIDSVELRAALSIVILISTVEFTRTIRPFMRVHAPAAIAVFNDSRYEMALGYSYKHRRKSRITTR